MKGEHLREVVEQLRRAAGPDAEGEPSDAELLGRWLAAREQSAFAQLLTRHAPMVLGVCRRVLHDGHEAEDALQATFLTLARKAGSISRREALAGWLYRVARRTALQARARRERRPVLTGQSLDGQPAAAAADLLWHDLRPALDEEIARLPEKCRVPFVLCHLEGRTNEEAARELGCPLGTVLSRLSRARERLRRRLTRRGLVLSAGALTAALAPAVPPPLLAERAICSAVAFAAGTGVGGTPAIIHLAEEVMKAMLLQKVRTVAGIVLLTLAVGGAGTGAFVFRLWAAEPAIAKQPAPAKPKPKSPAVPAPSPTANPDVLRKELLEAARRTYEQGWARYQAGQALPIPENTYVWSRRWLEAQLDLASSKEERTAAFRAHLERMKAIEKFTETYWRAGRGKGSDATAGKYFRVQAELWLARGAIR